MLYIVIINLHLQAVTGYYCLGVCYASNNPTRFFTGHFWTDVLRQKVSSLSTSMKTAWLCACEITLLKCLFSAVYSFNNLSFILVKICRVFIIPPNSVLCFNVTVCVQYAAWWRICADFILSQIYLNWIFNINIWSQQTYCNICALVFLIFQCSFVAVVHPKLHDSKHLSFCCLWTK